MSISPQLHDQIARQAAAMSMPFDETLTTLLRIGLAEQSKAEKEIGTLFQSYQASPSQPAMDRLGEAIFGKRSLSPMEEHSPRCQASPAATH